MIYRDTKVKMNLATKGKERREEAKKRRREAEIARFAQFKNGRRPRLIIDKLTIIIVKIVFVCDD